MKKVRYVFVLLAWFVSITAFAQKQNFSGTVVDTAGEPVIGASVVQKGTSNGSITDFDGHFTISTDAGAILVVSYVGYNSQEVRAAQGMHVVLKEDAQMLNDVVVIGYGVQKKSVVTASIAKVSAEDLSNKAPVRMDNALKGLAAGVNVTSNSGQPGSGSLIRIRGNNSVNSSSDPLYIVDGMPISGGLDFVNPNDIESIEVLKDAASGAIYGARAANGVVLVTTKKGKQGKTQINYNFSYGWQSAWKKRDVTGATDYATLMNEKYVNGGYAPLYADPFNLTDSNGQPISGFGTDWQELVFNDNAPVVNHDVTVSGASEKVNYYVSLGYFTQEGIVGGNYGQSNYDRLTLRSNTTFNLLDATKERNFLNKLDLNVNVAYMRTHSTGIGTNSEFGSVLGSALYLAPLLAPVALNYEDAYGQKHNMADELRAMYPAYELYADANGNPYTVPNAYGAYNEQNNPLAMMSLDPTPWYSHKFVPKFALDLQLWDNLKYHFSYSADMGFWGCNGGNTTLYYLSGNNRADHTSASAERYQGTTWQVENTLTYDKQLGKHSFGVVVGQSALKEKGDNLTGWHWGLINDNKKYINYTNGLVEYTKDSDGNITGVTIPYGVGGMTNAEHRMTSIFGRVSYNYDERYMFQGTIRRDGSSRFGTNNRYGVFPSFSVGWNVTNEKFMEPTHSWLSNLKVRGSWGKNGNEGIGDFQYTTLTAMGNNLFLGRVAQKHNGSKADKTANPDLKWEENEQTDLGLDFGFFNNALTFTLDYFIKKTNGMIITMPIPSYVGETKPVGNVGDMENKGWEFELGYKFNVADAHFQLKGNAAYLKNTLKNLGNAEGFVDIANGVQGLQGGGITRGENGYPFPYFYGYKTDGILQNQAEVDAYNAQFTENGVQTNGVRPGDVRFVDTDGDGKLTSDDRTKIGKGTPDWTFGVNLTADWKGFDFNLFMQGVTGADVFDATYRTDITSGNFPTWMLQRWTGPGSSDKYPALRLGDQSNWLVSDLYIYDGSYWRLKNISLGYTLPTSLTRKASIERLRLYVMAENLVTWTKYHGFDPEIGTGATSLGIDRGIYPQARTWTIGVNLSL